LSEGFSCVAADQSTDLSAVFLVCCHVVAKLSFLCEGF
jgi:hypothetical protein